MKDLMKKYGKKKVYGVAGGFLVLIIALIVAICVMVSNQNKLVINDKTLVIELGEEVSLKPSAYLDEKVDRAIANDTVLKSDLLTNEEKYVIDTEKQTVVTKDKEFLEVGKYDATLNYKKEELKITLEVKDTKAPAFKDVLKEVVVEQDAEEVDFTKFFEAEDLSEFKITANDKEVDLSKAGDYELEVTAKDKYDNANTVKATVKVVSLEEAEKEDTITKTLDGAVYQSKAMKDKIAEQQKIEEEKKAQEESANAGGVANSGGSTNNGGGGTTQAPAPQPNGIGAVINTAYSFVGRGDMMCNDLIVQSFKANNYNVPYDNAYYLGYSIGVDLSSVQAGDVIIMSTSVGSHAMLITSTDGFNFNVIEGGVNGSNVRATTYYKLSSANELSPNSWGTVGEKVTDIRRY